MTLLLARGCRAGPRRDRNSGADCKPNPIGYAEKALRQAARWTRMAWQKVASLADFGDRDVIGIELDGAAVALFRLGNDIHATSGVCTHEFADLANGFVE